MENKLLKNIVKEEMLSSVDYVVYGETDFVNSSAKPECLKY